MWHSPTHIPPRLYLCPPLLPTAPTTTLARRSLARLSPKARDSTVCSAPATPSQVLSLKNSGHLCRRRTKLLLPSAWSTFLTVDFACLSVYSYLPLLPRGVLVVCANPTPHLWQSEHVTKQSQSEASQDDFGAMERC